MADLSLWCYMSNCEAGTHSAGWMGAMGPFHVLEN